MQKKLFGCYNPAPPGNIIIGFSFCCGRNRSSGKREIFVEKRKTITCSFLPRPVRRFYQCQSDLGHSHRVARSLSKEITILQEKNEKVNLVSKAGFRKRFSAFLLVK
ncbi:hypothetical protein [Flavisolibacter nicotianae]|uniref:hypothetical protein n=1 Tax=Flavisolibacter nicotianae TaxID=2364882 RepID=UPI0013C4D8B8|nr:hypothetical protein [Flavisolibacter nicotianae]